MARLPSHAATTGLEVSAEERQAAVSCGLMVRRRGGDRGKKQRGLNFGWAGGFGREAAGGGGLRGWGGCLQQGEKGGKGEKRPVGIR